MFKTKGKLFSLLTACLTAVLALVLGFAALFAPTPITTASAESVTETLTIKGTTGVMSGTTSISWTQGGVTFRNDKASSSTAIRTSDSNHYRVYSGSTVTIEAPGNITTIVITSSESKYVDPWKTSATNAGATVTTNGNAITITPSKTSNEFTLTASAQIRLTQVAVTYSGGACLHSNTTTTTTATCTEAGSTTVTCDDCGETISTTETPATGHDYRPVEVLSEATCTTPGTQSVRCENCGNETTQEIPVIEHTFVNGSCSVCGEKEPTTKTDVLNRATTDAGNNSTYVSWSGKTATTNAVYAGNSAGSYDSIQLRSNNSNSGIITTTSGGQAVKVSVVWNGNTSSGRTLNVYGKNSAYSAATDLYNSSNQGTLIGTIVYGSSTELEISDEYAYIGLRSASGAMYITSISITWETTGCSHDNTREEITTDPTCTEAGSMSIVCDDCEATISTEEIPATGHVNTTTTTTDATCTEAGSTVVTCNDCGTKVSTTEIPALGHEIANGNPVNNENGTHSITGACSRCGETGETVTEDCNFERAENEPKYTCTVCGYFYTVAEYTVTYEVPKGISSVAKQTVEEGKSVILPSAESKLHYTFVGWVIGETTETTVCPEILAAGSEYTVTTNVALNALYSYEGTSYSYQKVTKEPADWSGEYLIVYEDEENNAYIFNSEDAVNGYVSATTNGSSIAYSETVAAEAVTIASMEGGYSILTKNGYISGSNSGNKLNFDKTTAQLNTIALADDDSVTITSGRVLRFNSASNQMRFRYYTAGSQQPIYLYKYALVLNYATDIDCTADFDAANATVEADITMNYYVNLSEDLVAGTTMQFVIGDNMYEIAPKKEADGERYVFSLPNLPPHLMAETIVANLVYNEQTLATQNDYSVKIYAQNLLTTYPDNEKLVNFLTAMLYYGDAAQVHEGQAATTTTDVSGLAEVGDVTVAEENNKMVLTNADGIDTCTAWFVSANVWFSSVNKIRITLSTAENVTLKINDVEVPVNGTTVYTDGIAATAFGEKVTFELYHNGDLMQTLEYSIYSYAYSMQNKATMGELVKALYRYGEAAKVYNGQ